MYVSQKKDEVIHVGGQAVIEGVMMRSPDAVAVAVRKPDGSIVYDTRSYVSLTKRSKFWALPVIRGAVVLIESLALGIKALTFSSEVAIEEEGRENEQKRRNAEKESVFTALLPKIMMIFTVIAALGIGVLLFFYLPLAVTHLFGINSGVLFNLIDGILRLAVFLAYLGAISMWKEIRRVFEYHGAEHKSICSFENKEPLTLESARKYSTLHPRCGTSFLLVVVIVSIFVFVLLGKPSSPIDPIVLVRLSLVPLIAGLAYEVIKLSDRHRNNPLVSAFVAPGLWLQKITTKEPDDAQLEVAFVALRSALGEDVSNVATQYTKLDKLQP